MTKIKLRQTYIKGFEPQKTAEERMVELSKTPFNEMPKLAYEYSKFLCNKFGMCGEVYLTAFAHYAQAVEGLECKDDLYIIGEEGKKWFGEHKNENS